MPITGKQIADGAITNPKLGSAVTAQIPQIIDKDLVTSPGGTSIGDMYIIAGTGGNWSGGTIDDVAEALDTTGTLWSFKTPNIGFTANVLDEDALYQFETSGWEYHTAHSLADQTSYSGIRAGNVPVSSGVDNTALGFEAAAALTTGTQNVILGSTSGSGLTTGSDNILIGQDTAPALLGGSSNIVIGTSSASALTSGISNIIIGEGSAPSLTTGTGNIVIGAGIASGLPAATGDHLDLGGTVFGDLLNNRIRIGGSGVVSSVATLELENTAPLLRLFETGAGVDEKNYDIKMSGGALVIEALPDDLGSGNDIISISRTGTVLNSIALGEDSPEFVFFHNQADNTEAMLTVENGGTNGAAFDVFTGDVTPIGSVTGEPGDLYVQSRAGVASTTYQHKGASANNTDWVIIGPGVLQTDFTEVAVNTTTTSVAFPGSTLLTTTITKKLAASDLIVHFSAGTSNTNNGRQMFFRVVVDGVTQRGTAVDCPNSGIAQSASIVVKTSGVAAGSRIIAIQWYVSANTGQVRPVAAPDSEHASMLVEEVLV